MGRCHRNSIQHYRPPYTPRHVLPWRGSWQIDNFEKLVWKFSLHATDRLEGKATGQGIWRINTETRYREKSRSSPSWGADTLKVNTCKMRHFHTIILEGLGFWPLHFRGGFPFHLDRKTNGFLLNAEWNPKISKIYREKRQNFPLLCWIWDPISAAVDLERWNEWKTRRRGGPLGVVNGNILLLSHLQTDACKRWSPEISPIWRSKGF